MAEWLKEKFSPYEIHLHKFKKIIRKKRTKFQNMVIADTYSFGKCLLLDGEIQSALSDEKIYHELLVHPAAGFCGLNPEKVIILGGGEGATLREVLRWKCVRQVLMVDIDGETVEFCKKYLSQWHMGSFLSPRAKVIYEDAFSYVENSKAQWDLIIMDLPCPIEGGPAYKLYSLEFFKILKAHLTKGGFLATQAGGASRVNSDFHFSLYATMKKAFKHLMSYQMFVPSFDVPWAFIAASDEKFSSRDKAWAKIRRGAKGTFNALNAEVLDAIGKNPEFFKKGLDGGRIITRKKPVYFFK
ncbi:spermidine synthase [bacterium]|nr:spermidine synthase [bacterium]